MNIFNHKRSGIYTFIQAIHKVIPFMEIIKEVYFIFDINLPNPKVFSKVFKYNQSCIAIAVSKTISPRKKTLLLIIIIFEALCNIRLFRYAILM